MSTQIRFFAVCVTILLMSGINSPAQAAFTSVPTPPAVGNPRPDEQNSEEFLHTWTWDFTNGQINPATVPGPNWEVVVGSLGDGPRTLFLEAAHLPPPPHAGDIPRNPPTGRLGPLSLLGLVRPAAGTTGFAKAKQFKHPSKGADHFDVLSLSALIPKEGAATVVAQGRHNEKSFARWSYLPFLKGIIDVDASYPNGNLERVVEGENVIPNSHEGGPLVPKGNPPNPTDYVVTFKTNPTTEMTLAFPGEVDGAPGRLYLANGFELFADANGEIIAPMLIDASGASDPLYIGVNLVEWLSFPSPTSLFDDVGDMFSIVNGQSSLLEGFLVSRAPLSTDASGDFFASDPQDLFTGLLSVAGTVDGHSVPEPSTVLLLTVGLVGLVGQRWWRRKRAGREESTLWDTTI